MAVESISQWKREESLVTAYRVYLSQGRAECGQAIQSRRGGRRLETRREIFFVFFPADCGILRLRLIHRLFGVVPLAKQDLR